MNTKKPILFTLVLLLLTYSCAVDEIEPREQLVDIKPKVSKENQIAARIARGLSGLMKDPLIRESCCLIALII